MKNTMKRTVKYLLLFVAVIMMSFVINTETLAAEEYIDGYYTYTVTDGEATIVNVDEAICGEVFIPEALGGYPVVSFNSRNNCDKITTLIIPYSVKAIEKYAFVDWNSIEAFIVDSNNEYFSSVDGVLFNKDQTVLIQYPTGNKRTTYRVPNGVVSLQDMAHCKHLVNLILPDSVESFGVFADSTSLKALTMTNSVKNIKDSTFFSTYLDYIYFVGTSDEWEALIENYVDYGDCTEYIQIPEIVFVDETHLKNVELNVVDSTCTTEGVKTTNCLCGCGYTLYETLQKKHNCISEITDEATHLKEGKKTYTCLLCDYSYVETIPKTPEHFYEESTVTPPTCTSQGYTTYACKCGDTYTDNYVDTIDHTYTESIISQPTCNTVGKKQFYCTTCHTYKYETIPTNDEHIDNDNNGYCDRCKVLFAYTEGYYHYTVKDEKATIIDIDNSISGDVVIPSTLGGYPVVAIGDEAFAESFNITSVVIPEGVTYIDEDAFALCYRMESVTLPESLETIENWVFGACLSLKEIVLPENVVSINDSAFDSCLSLEKIVVKNAEASIGEYICYTTLLPKDITTSEWVEKYITAYEAMLNGDENAETLMAELESHTTILEDEAAVLPELTIYSHDPSTAKTYAEENGIKFEEITDIPTSGTCGNNSTWSFDSETGELVISGSGTAGLERDDSGNFIIPWELLKPNIKSMVVENGIEGIGGFENCVNLKVVTLADSIIVFGDEAFRNCSSLEEIKLPQSLTMIGAAAFCDCTSLKEVVIPDTVEYIYPGAFVKCFNLESVKLPSYLTCIEDDVFNYCYKLKHLEIPETVTKIDGNPFVCCVSLKEISIPAGVTTIEPAAFENCWALEDIYIYSEQLGLDNSLLGEISAYKGIEEYYGSTNKDQNITSYINVSLKYLSGDADAQETIEGIVDCIQKYEKPIYSETLTIHGYAGSNAETYANKNGIKFEVINENTTIADSNTGVEIEYDNSAFECEVELVVSEEEINANIVFGDEFENFKSFDISLEADGEKVQPKGYVTVKLPIPADFNAETTVVYYVDDSGNKTKLESTTENGYIVFETNHFSEYVLVDESSKIEPPHEHSYTSAVTKNPTCTEAGVKTFTCSCSDSYTESIPALGHKDANGDYKCDNGCGYEYEKPAPEQPEDPSKDCSCNCHKGGFMGFIWKIINFFQKLFKSNQVCKCGVKHY